MGAEKPGVHVFGRSGVVSTEPDVEESGDAPLEATPPLPLSPAPHLSSALPLAILIALALALRLWGITWGLPDQRHLFSYHPDEGVNLIQGVLDHGEVR